MLASRPKSRHFWFASMLLTVRGEASECLTRVGRA